MRLDFLSNPSTKEAERMTQSIRQRRRRRNPLADKAMPLPLATRFLMRRFGLMPGMAAVIADAAGFNVDIH